jgi:uncharacterized phage protein (TIGR01671 family)
MTNRIIKFRAWDEKTKQIYKIISLNCRRNGTVSGTIYRKGSGLTTCLTMQNPPIMQFTGFLDKNGKECFEGDIVRCTNGSEGVWVWSNKTGMYRIDTTQTIKGWNHPIEGFDQDTMEIIGNIYENPKLLNS